MQDIGAEYMELNIISLEIILETMTAYICQGGKKIKKGKYVKAEQNFELIFLRE